MCKQFGSIGLLYQLSLVQIYCAYEYTLDFCLVVSEGSAIMRNNSILVSILLIHIIQHALCGSDFKCEKDSDDNKKPVCIPKKYDAFKLPRAEGNEIGVSLSYIKVISVDEKDFSLTFETFFNIEWQDERLELTKHHSKAGLVPVDEELIEDIWLPNVFVYDLNSFEVVEVLGKMSGVWVDEKKNVLYSQAVRMKVFCLMDFGMYPFDEQKCKLRVGSYSYQDSKMSFVNKDITKYTKEDSPLPQKIGKKKIGFLHTTATKFSLFVRCDCLQR